MILAISSTASESPQRLATQIWRAISSKCNCAEAIALLIARSATWTSGKTPSRPSTCLPPWGLELGGIGHLFRLDGDLVLAGFLSGDDEDRMRARCPALNANGARCRLRVLGRLHDRSELPRAIVRRTASFVPGPRAIDQR